MTKVYLVGAGPGDPELLTLKARRLLTLADCILYDNLANVDFLDFARPDAERIYVGKKKAIHSMPQEEICALLVERGRRGLNVVRLKGGDPYLFGRGGEEAEQLTALRIPFEIIPGVSAALGADASAGIPLTHRDAASSVSFVTAHKRHDGGADHLASRVPRTGTVVLYMGLATLRETATALVAAGRSPTTPVAVISHATLATQREVIADLATIADAVEAAALPAPALVIVGEVVDRRVVSVSALAPAAAPVRAGGAS